MNENQTIAIGGDHAGFAYKQMLIDLLTDYQVKDFGGL